jgi:hypothetical protein
MRRIAIITAGAALALALVVPSMAEATGRTSTPKSTTISAQSVSLDDQFTAQGSRGHHSGGKSGYRKGYRHGYRDGRHDSGGYHRHGYGGGRCYGCWGPGSYCSHGGCYYRGYYGYGYGYGYGGYGYGYGDPSNWQYDCTKYRGPDGQPVQDPQCKYDAKCGCYYHSSEPPADAGAQPAPDQGAPPAPDQGAAPRPY